MAESHYPTRGDKLCHPSRGIVVSGRRRAYSEGMEQSTNVLAEQRSQAIMEIERQTGPSNFFRAMSHRPDAMRGVAQLYGAIMAPGGAVSERQKELVYLAVSSVNECDYCSAHHDVSSKKVNISPEEIEDVRAETDYHFNEAERAALRYARELTRTASADHETREGLERWFQPDQRVELTLVIALANFTNRFNNGLRIPLEKEKHLTA